MKTCSKPDCKNKAISNGLCKNHYYSAAREKARNYRKLFTEEIPEDTLLEIAASPVTDKLDKLKMHEAMRFIIAKQIKVGDFRIERDAILYLYQNWSATPTSPKVFFSFFNKIFTYKQAADKFFYNLDVEPFMPLLEKGVFILDEQKVSLCVEKEIEEA